MVDQQTKNSIRAKVDELVNKANSLFHSNVRDVFIFYKNISQAGLAAFEKGQYVITFQESLASQSPDKILTDVIPHEVAHLVCFYIGMTGGPIDYKHGAQWRRISLALGGTGKATVRIGLKTPARPYKYIASDGEVVYVSTRTHHILQRELKVYKTKSGATVTAAGYSPDNSSILRNPTA